MHDSHSTSLMHEMNLRHNNRKIDAFLGEADCFRLVQSGKASYAGYLTWDDHSSIQPQVAFCACSSMSTRHTLRHRIMRQRHTHTHARTGLLNLDCSRKPYPA